MEKRKSSMIVVFTFIKKSRIIETCDKGGGRAIRDCTKLWEKKE